MVSEYEAIKSALTDLHAMLEQDGYVCTVRVDDETIEVAVSAGPEACADCLVPPSVMAPMVEQMLLDADIQMNRELTLVYPHGGTPNTS